MKYPLRPLEFISWDEFQEVCVCYSGYSSRGPNIANSAICCVKKGEEKNAFGRWKTTASYAIGCVMNGEEMDAKGWAMAAVTGAVCGGVGGALGMATNGIVKGIGSICIGIFSGVVTGISSGSAGKGIVAGTDLLADGR